MCRFYLFLVALLLAIACSGAQDIRYYELKVDPTSGQDIASCNTGNDTTVSPSIACKTIQYAVSISLQVVTEIDQLQLHLLPGEYTGTSNTNINIDAYKFYLTGNVVDGQRPVINCGYSSHALTLTPPANDNGVGFYSITDVDFKNCVSSLGGAITLLGLSVVTNVAKCTFSNNRATQNGGAVHATGSGSLIFSNCTFVNNSAVQNGGALAAIQKRTLRATNCVFRSNSADTGGAIYGNEMGGDRTTQMFLNNTFSNNLVATKGGAFFAESENTRYYTFENSVIDNNCASSIYTDSYDVQVRCASSKESCNITNKGVASGCTATYVPPEASSDDGGEKSNKDRAIIIGVVVPFGIIAIVAIALFFYLRKRHTSEMTKRDDYRKKILAALDNLPPEEQEAARLEAERADPKSPKCQLCQIRPINSPLPCGHEIVCSVCRTILLECPVKNCKKATR